jgi:hypothetical protein
VRIGRELRGIALAAADDLQTRLDLGPVADGERVGGVAVNAVGSSSMITLHTTKNCDLGPVTNQVTTAPGSSRRAATAPDAGIPFACDNPTGRDFVGRNRHAW